MWRNWWLRRAARANDEAASIPIDVGTATSDPFAIDGIVSPRSLDVWELPYSELPCSDVFADEAVTSPALPTDADAAQLFAVDDVGRFGALDQIDDGWWLPPPSRRSVMRVGESVRAGPAPTRRVDRIALLYNLRGRFDPERVADVLAAAA